MKKSILIAAGLIGFAATAVAQYVNPEDDPRNK